jgi:hypothetical protein
MDMRCFRRIWAAGEEEEAVTVFPVSKRRAKLRSEPMFSLLSVLLLSAGGGIQAAKS